MGSTLTKKELMASILKRCPELPKEKLQGLPMKDLWLVDRRLTLEKYKAEYYIVP